MDSKAGPLKAQLVWIMGGGGRNKSLAAAWGKKRKKVAEADKELQRTRSYHSNRKLQGGQDSKEVHPGPAQIRWAAKGIHHELVASAVLPTS